MRTGSVHEVGAARAKPTRGWKSPYAWALIPVLAMMVVGGTSVVLKRWQADDAAYNGGLIFGAVGGVAIASGFFYLISLFFGLIARRSRLVLSISLALLASLSTIGNSFVLYRTLTRTPPTTSSQIEKQVEQLIAQFEAQSHALTASGDTSMNYKGMAVLASQFRALAGEYRGNDGEYLYGLAAIYDALSDLRKSYAEALTQAQSTWPLQPERIQSLDDIATARQDLNRLLQSTVTLRDLMIAPQSWVHEVLVSNAIDSPEGESAFIRGLFQNADGRSIQIKTFEIDIEFVHTLLKMCDLLESQYGNWEAMIGLVIFEDEASDKQWDDMVGEIERLGSEQQAMVQEYLLKIGG